MRISVALALLALPLVAVMGCHSTGGGASAAGSSTSTAVSGGPPSGGPLDYSGVWDVSGTDVLRGDYQGTASVV
ncbi:MAG: hypothetical protein ACRELB_08585, partial [Polyangiaceae bacterium]